MDDLNVSNALFVGDNEPTSRQHIGPGSTRRHSSPTRVDTQLDVTPDHDVSGLEDVVHLASRRSGSD